VGIDPVRLAAIVATAAVLIAIAAVVLDDALAERRQDFPKALTAFFQFVTRFGRSDWLLIPSGVIALLVFCGDWRRPARAVAAAWREIGAYAGVFFAAIAIPGIVNDIIKPIVGRVRPNVVVDGDVAFAPFSLGYAYASFPSGHANTMAALAVLAVATFGARGIPIILAALVVAMSRVALGVHHVSDVAAGILVGAVLSWLVVRRAARGGLGFTLDASGSVAPRLVAARHIMGQPGGLRRLVAAAAKALAWR
jgi:undecaprenyl-diphosphatase